MVSALSYLIAIILTLCLAIILYPISGLFWILGLFGKVSDVMFRFTTKVIRSLWRDIRGMNKESKQDNLGEQWQCQCGKMNTGKFCSECGNSRNNIMAVSTNLEEEK